MASSGSKVFEHSHWISLDAAVIDVEGKGCINTDVLCMEVVDF